MKPFVFISLLLFCCSCRKENPDTVAKVSYTISESSADAPIYAVTYTADHKSSQQTGGLTASSWSSPTVTLKRGDFVSFNLQSSDPTGDFTMRIYLNGVLWKTKTASNPNCNVTISGDLP